MAFLQFSIDLARTATALERIGDELIRIREAVERVSPAIGDKPTPVVAGLSDLRSTDPNTVGRITRELELFAENHNVMLNSESFINAIMSFEREVESAYGGDAIRELPWNKAAGGPLFRPDGGYGGRS